MKIYVDLILILNFVFDFLLLLSVSIILRRNAKINRIIFGAFVGGLSILTLFFKINSLQLFFIKIIISILMTLISFGFKSIRYTLKNLIFLYFASMILGGFLYFLNLEFSYKHEGLIFYHHGFSINVIFLIIVSPVIIYFYVKESKQLKNNYANYYKISLYLNNQKIALNAYLDTGNKLTDPYKKRPIILVDKRKILFEEVEFKMVLVPYETLNYKGILKCIKADFLDIEGIGIRKNFLVGIMEDKIKIDGIDCIINTKLMEG